jgi:propionyl-CoA carboxylase alpha chain
MRQERFRSGRLTTAYIAEEFPDGFTGVSPDEEDKRFLAAVALHVHQVVQERAVQISGTIGNHRRKPGKDWVVRFSGTEIAASGEATDKGRLVTFQEGQALTLTSSWMPGQSIAHFDTGKIGGDVKVDLTGTAIRLRWRGIDVMAHVRTPKVAALAGLIPEKPPRDTSKMLLCPMPGVLASITVNAGDTVEAGQALATVEAMKMENVLRAEKRAVIKRIAAAAGASLAVDELIMEFE